MASPNYSKLIQQAHARRREAMTAKESCSGTSSKTTPDLISKAVLAGDEYQYKRKIE
ncbi:MAG: hypothetical protein ACYCX4_18000 [Bacillota bacterium]